jgi:hypothetical protein
MVSFLLLDDACSLHYWPVAWKEMPIFVTFQDLAFNLNL